MELNLRCSHTCCENCNYKCDQGCLHGCGAACRVICGRVAAYGWGLPTRCPAHYVAPMIMCYNVKCAEPGCGQFPIYGLRDRQPRRCAAHRLATDMLAKGDVCRYPGCCIECRNTDYCLQHTERRTHDDTDNDLKCCTVDACTLNATYGFYNTGKLFCVFHSALDVNIYAVERNTVKCSKCPKMATQYSNIFELLKNPYAVPDICVQCATTAGLTVRGHNYCNKCGCYALMCEGGLCASCQIARLSDRFVGNVWNELLRPISKRFIVKPTPTGEFICTIRSRVCKNGNRNVFILPNKHKNYRATPQRYTKIILSPDARTHVRNRYIRTKLLAGSTDTLVVMNESPHCADYDTAEENFVRDFNDSVLPTFDYYTIEEPIEDNIEKINA